VPTRTRAATVLAASGLALVPAGAPAAPAGSGGGGVTYVAKPRIGRVTCARSCASRRRARTGSVLRISGRNLGTVRQVVFLGSYGRGDDVTAVGRPRGSRRLAVRVPMGAVSGPVAVQVSPAVRVSSSRAVPILPPPPPTPNVQLSPVPGIANPRIETGTSTTRAFFGARATAVFSYRIAARVPVTLRIEVVSARDGTVAQGWSPQAQPGQVASVTWSGRVGRAAAAPGRYFFRLTVQGARGVTARTAQGLNVQRDAFDLFTDTFPIRGRHRFGGAGARFGAGRAGHRHQGQDVFARCGKPLVAARGGRVKARGFQRSAGNYLVIDGAGTQVDYGYMHLAEPSAFSQGDRVYTGQPIGSVGQTGNARGCHLHFELWRGPGWYSGGRPFDPLPSLLAWDSWS
jgi:murein DD-endopeptidase MepM/ murein hydrolase activator NlpD